MYKLPTQKEWDEYLSKDRIKTNEITILTRCDRALRPIVEKLVEEDLDSDEYGMRCHWCHAEMEYTPEFTAYQTEFARRMEEAFPGEHPLSMARVEMMALRKQLQEELVWPDEVQQVAHKEDCLMLQARAALEVR